MEKFSEIFGNFSQKIATFWAGLNLSKRVALGAGALITLTALSLVFALRSSSTYEYLFVDVSPEDVQAISAYLKKSGLDDYQIDGKGVKVPADQVIQYRLKLTQEGLPTQGQVGWEKFDDPDFTRTEFERKIHKNRAIEGELARTIAGLEGIHSARVHIAIPQKRLFDKDEKKPTAAIYIKSKRGSEITSRQIRGIVHLVSKSVEDLDQENISIIDFEGKLLTEEKSKDPAERQSKEMLDYQKSIEKNLEEKIRAIVGRIVGQERVEAKVEALLDFTQEEQTISDVDPERVAAVSTQTSNQSLDGTGLNPTGIPGAKSNVPGETGNVNQASSGTKNKNDSELINYEISKSVKHKRMQPVTIQRISAAVIVDGKQANVATSGMQPEFQARPKEEMDKIAGLVRSAIGFVEGRDIVTVDNMLFQLDFMQVEALQAKKKEDRQYISTLAISAVVALSLVLFFAFIVRPYFRWLSYDPQRKASEAIIDEFKADLDMGGTQNIQIKEDVPFDKLTPQQQVIFIAKNEPERTTEALRMLLNPHNSIGV